jgi:methylmalonyl-CoA mutase N-terminal domain/subunit
MRVSYEVEREQNRALAARRATRDDAAVQVALDTVVAAARSDENMIPAMLDAARAEATLGEICGVLRTEWGTYTEPPQF